MLRQQLVHEASNSVAGIGKLQSHPALGLTESPNLFFLALGGRFDIALRGADGTERTVTLNAGDGFVVPKDTLRVAPS